jgi:Flp pilus assembly protein protease CpaA
MFVIIIIAVAIIALLIASFTDLRTREVPDYLSYTLIGSAIVIRVLWFIAEGNASILFWVPISFSILFLFSYLMYKAGQWGGGDVKVMMGLSILLSWLPISNFPFFIDFFFNTLIVGAFYGMFAVGVLGLINYKELQKYLTEIDYILLPALLIIVVLLFKILPSVFAFLAALIFVSVGLFKYFKVIETNFLHQSIPIPNLTEGDWLLDDVKLRGKVVVPKREIGLIEEDLKKLRLLYKNKKIQKVLIKVGVPFVPAFLISLIITLIFGNVLVSMMNYSLFMM